MPRVLIAFALFLSGILCLAQSSQAVNLHVGTGRALLKALKKATPPTGYQGPGDITSGAVGFYSCGRAYNAAYATAGGAACDVVDTATGLVTCTLDFLSTGFVNTTQCTGVGLSCAVACSVAKMYDQTGTGNHVIQATLANMPALTFSAQNGLPCVAGTNNAAMVLATSGTISVAAPYTYTAVTERTTTFNTLQGMISAAAAVNRGIHWGAGEGGIGANNGNAVSLVVTEPAFHAIVNVASATAPLLAADSSSNINTTTNGSTTLASTVKIGNGNGTSTALLSGFICEAGLWPSDLNSTYTSMLANMRSATVGWNF